MNPSYPQVRRDWTLLDADDFVHPPDIKIITDEKNAGVDDLAAEYITPNRFVRLFPTRWFLHKFLYAWQILWAADQNTVIIMNASNGVAWLFAGYLNRLLQRFGKHRRCLVLRDCFLEYHLGKERRFRFFPFLRFKTEWKVTLARGALLGYDSISVWSKKQVEPHAKMFNLPVEMFVAVPFKANHSKRWHPRRKERRQCRAADKIPAVERRKGERRQRHDTATFPFTPNNFVFAGGNDKRDYPCLVEAIRGTEIPVIISATNPKTRQQVEMLPNIILLGAPEPAYGQLMAASRFLVVPMVYSGVKGGAEAYFCDGMWHSKPVIACCNIAAEDYIVDGETGYVVPSGDSEGLRRRMLELWNDPEKCKEMGRKGRERCEKYFAHELHMRRFLRLALVVLAERH